jgi:hypothetical protein
VFWKFRKQSITISAELHEKLAQTCEPIEEVPSAVLRVRRVKRRRQEPERIPAGLKPNLLCGM